MKKNFLALLFLILILVLSLSACEGYDDEMYYDDEEYYDGEADYEEDYTSEEEASAVPAAPAATTGEPGTWLVMLYQNADDQVLEQDIFIDLNEAELVGSDENVTIVSQIDRYENGFDGDGDWSSTKRFLVQQDDDLDSIGSQEIEDLGEVDMGDWQTLVDFAVWAIETYPADRHILILSDHGAGWFGGWNDDSPYEGSSFTLENIDQALSEVIKRTGIDAFELVGFDACLMGQLEVFSAVAPYARYAVASEETEPSLGWAYASFLSSLSANPAMGGDVLAKLIVESYIDQDYRIVDDDARMLFISEVYGVEEEYSAEEVAREMSLDITLTAVDLSGMSALNEAVNNLAFQLVNVDQSDVARARTYAQSYESVFGEDVQPSYIDLGHFISILANETSDDDVLDAIQAVQKAIRNSVLAEKHGENLSGSTGYSIFFPNSKLFKETSGRGDYTYTEYASRFAAASLWDDYLTFHYTGSQFDPGSADLSVLGETPISLAELGENASQSQPESSAEITSPASGEISLSPLELSAEQIDIDSSVTLTTTVSGTNIGFIYYYVAWYDEESDSYMTADKGYIESDEIKNISGILFPDWGSDTSFELSIDWEPTIYFISNGYEEEDQFAFFEPEVFGATPETDIYSVSGVYTYSDSGETRYAVMKFTGDGKMKAIYGFTGENMQGAVHQITPKSGDQFTVIEEWLEFEQNEEGELVLYEGGTITFRDRPITMEAYYGYPGEYILGIILEDIDGNFTEQYAGLLVTE